MTAEWLATPTNWDTGTGEARLTQSLSAPDRLRDRMTLALLPQTGGFEGGVPSRERLPAYDLTVSHRP